MSEFFIRRPIVAMVISIFMVLLGLPAGLEQAEQHCSGLHALDRRGSGRLHAKQDVGGREHLGGILRTAHVGEILVAEMRRPPRTGLDQQLRAETPVALRDLRNQRDAALAGDGLGGYSDDHGHECSLMYESGRKGHESAGGTSGGPAIPARFLYFVGHAD